MKKMLLKIFPFLRPLKMWIRKKISYLKMHFDGHIYAKLKDDEILPFKVCEVKEELINKKSGYDIKYQYNKVDNLKVAGKEINNLLILPGETFSFNYLEKNKKGKYKKGLVSIDGKITPKVGGGICGLSNLLYYAFLHTDLKILERHHHNVKNLPNPSSSSLFGVDATISSGYKDLKVKNETDKIYQIKIIFTDSVMIIKIYSDKDCLYHYKIVNQNHEFIKKNGKVYEKGDVVKEVYKEGKKIKEIKLYDEEVWVTYMKGDEK